MKRKVLSFILALCMIFASMVLVSCQKDAEEGTMTRMTVDINPSVEFMIDDENKVVSVTALNDDGSVLIVGEAFVGKTPEEAVELMVSVAADTGYLVKGNVEADENTVKISVSGDTKYAESLLEDAMAKAESTLASLDIAGNIEAVDALATDALRALAATTSSYTEEELEQMNEEELYSVIAEGRIETALILTQDMREAYFEAKEYEVSFAESEAVAEVIKSLGGLYTLTYTAYKSALDMYSAAITELDALRYDLLISPESEYQKSLQKLRDAKVDLIAERTYTASLDVNGEEYANATVSLGLSEERFNEALVAYEALGEKANEAIEKLIAVMREAETKLRELEDTLFDDNIEEALLEKASEIEAGINTAKAEFFEQFESAHADDIAQIEQSLMDKKEELKANIE